MGAPTLTDVDEFRSRANAPTAVSDESLELILVGTEALAKRFLGYDPVSQSTTLYLDGRGDELLPLGQPVSAVTTVHENAVGYGQSANFTSTELLTLGTDYLTRNVGTWRDGVLVRIGALWPYDRRRQVGRLADEYGPAYGSVKVVCTVGLTGADLEAVSDAVYYEAATRFQTRSGGVGPVTSESLDGYSYSRSSTAGEATAQSPFLSPVAFQTLRAYRRVPLPR